MSDEIRELQSEIIALKEINSKLEGENAELKEKTNKLEGENDKLKEENAALKAGSSQQKLFTSSISIPISQPVKRSQESEPSECILNIKRPKTIKEIFIPNWLIETFQWINPKEMANSSLSTSCETFRRLCWPKKSHKILYLKFTKIRIGYRNFRAKIRNWDNEIIPIASIPPPNYIVGIGVIIMKYLDEQIVTFIKNIAHMLQNCLLYFNIGLKMDKKKVILMSALLECLAEKIFKFTFNGPNLREFFNGVFPGILDYIHSIKYDGSILDIYEIDDYLIWLTKHSNNGKQKTLELGFCCGQKFMIMTTFINRIKEEFSNSNSPSNFIAFYSADWVHEEFTLENARTNEILILYCKLDSLFYLARYPKGEEYWKEFGEKKIHQIHDFTIINIDACCLVNLTCSDKRCQ